MFFHSSSAPIDLLLSNGNKTQLWWNQLGNMIHWNFIKGNMKPWIANVWVMLQPWISLQCMNAQRLSRIKDNDLYTKIAINPYLSFSLSLFLSLSFHPSNSHSTVKTTFVWVLLAIQEDRAFWLTLLYVGHIGWRTHCAHRHAQTQILDTHGLVWNLTAFCQHCGAASCWHSSCPHILTKRGKFSVA